MYTQGLVCPAGDVQEDGYVQRSGWLCSGREDGMSRGVYIPLPQCLDLVVATEVDDMHPTSLKPMKICCFLLAMGGK